MQEFRKLAAIAIGACLFATAPAAAAELVVNGNFEAGNTGFTSTYAFVSGATGSHQGTPTYALATSPITAANAFPDWGTYGDHTSGSGLMLVADGAASAVWSENVIITPGVYTYSFWARQSDANSGSNPVLQFVVNNVPFGTLSVSSSSADGWQHEAGTLTSTVTAPITISIVDTNNSIPFNDFALDDISFSTPTVVGGVPEPASWAMLLVGFGGIGAAARARRSSKSVTA